MDKRNLAYVFVFLAIVIWASSAAVAKLLLKDISSIQCLFLSLIFAVLGLFIVDLFQRKLSMLKKYSRNDYLRMAGIGFVGCYVYPMSLLAALMLAPAQEAFIINYLWPIMIVVFAVIILKEKLGILKVFGVLLGFVGVYVVATQGNVLDFVFTNLTADALAALGAAAYGLFSVFTKKFNYEQVSSLLIYNTIGLACAAATFFLFSSMPLLSMMHWVGLFWSGAVTNGVAYIFWLKALKYGDTSKIATMTFLTPFLSLVYIYFLLGERILLSSIIGLVIIVLGIVVQSLRRGPGTVAKK